MSLYAVSFFVWATHKNFGVLVKGTSRHPTELFCEDLEMHTVEIFLNVKIAAVCSLIFSWRVSIEILKLCLSEVYAKSQAELPSNFHLYAETIK